MRKKRPLTDKQEIAVHNYCMKGIIKAKTGYSWSQAMRDAGYKEGYITKCQFSLRKKPGIKKLIETTKDKLFHKLDLTAEKVLKEIGKIGFSNIKDYLTINNEGEMSLKDFQGIDVDKLAAIESIKVNTTKEGEKKEFTTTQFKLCSKLTALEQLGKHLGIFEADNKQKAPDVRKYDIKELKMLVLEGDKRDKKVLEAGTGVVDV